MRRAGLAIAATLVALPASSAHAASSYCSPTGDLCMQVRKRDGVLRIQLDTFSLRGRVLTCVSRGERRDCKRFRLTSRGRRVTGIDVRWSAHFPDRGPGTYTVRFSQGGQAFGRPITFTIRRRT